jgi:hypothetical protein
MINNKSCRSEDNAENRLQFKGVYFALLNTFSVNVITSTHNEIDLIKKEAKEILRNLGAEWNGPYADDFEIIERFLFPDSINKLHTSAP